MKNLIPKRVMEYIIITFAVVLMDVGIYVFKFPNNFSFGGVSGMAVVFSHNIPRQRPVHRKSLLKHIQKQRRKTVT